MTTCNSGRPAHLDIDEPDVGRGERDDSAGDYGAGVKGGGHPGPVPGAGRKKVLTHQNHINKNLEGLYRKWIERVYLIH